MKVLVACEESQVVTIAFRNLGHEAYSCDIQECSGGRPEWHLHQDVIPLLDDPSWDLVIAHPDCTFLSVAGNSWFNVEKYGEKAIKRMEDRELAVEFFMKFANCICSKVAIENPVGIMSTRWRKPDQYIQPWQFGHPTTKKTGLWLKGLPNLTPTDIVEPENYIYKGGKKKGGKDPLWHMETIGLPAEERRRARSKTFQGIAEAMANQWGIMD